MVPPVAVQVTAGTEELPSLHLALRVNWKPAVLCSEAVAGVRTSDVRVDPGAGAVLSESAAEGAVGASDREELAGPCGSAQDC
jgi:hypothetical protein